MKVLVVSSKYPPEYAGSGFRAHKTYRRLKKKFGLDAEVICNSVEFSESDTYTHEGIAVQRIVAPGGNWLDDRALPAPILRAKAVCHENLDAALTWRELERRDFDILHVFGHSGSTAMAIWWARRNNIPLMLEICNVRSSPYQYFRGVGKLLNTPLGRPFEYNLGQKTIVVAISRRLGEMCARYGLIKNVWTRPNPVDESRFNPGRIDDNTTAPDLSKFDTDDVVLLYIAYFKPRKNHDFLLNVLAELPEQYKLILGGPIDTEGENAERDRQVVNEIRNRIDELGLQSRVDLQVGFKNMAKYLSIADVFCFPSENEAMGTPLLESLCSGVPVVATGSEPSFREWIANGKNGYLRPLDANAWADAVSSAVDFRDADRRTFADSMLDEVSSEVIDAQYHQLLSALVESEPPQELMVDCILADERW